METSPPRPRSTAATVAVYLFGFLLLVIGFFAQEAADSIAFPRGVSPGAAGMIGGLSPTVIISAGLIAWYRWFRGRSGSAMMLVGFIALAKGGGALVARLLIVSCLAHS